jgi:hypothetical protein
MNRFPNPVEGEWPLGEGFGGLFPTMTGDVLIVTHPDEQIYLYIDVGMFVGTPDDNYNWREDIHRRYYRVPINITLSPETTKPYNWSDYESFIIEDMGSILGVPYTISSTEVIRSMWGAREGYFVRWQTVDLATPLDMSRFSTPAEGQWPLGEGFGGLFPTKTGDVLVVTHPEGQVYLYVDVGMFGGSPDFNYNWLEDVHRVYHRVLLDITLSPERTRYFDTTVYERMLLNEIGRDLLINNLSDVMLWNRLILEMLPTDEASLAILTQPCGNPLMDSDHPAVVAKAQEITAGLRTDMEKARAINDWIAANIYYDEHLGNIWWQIMGTDYQQSRMLASNTLELRRTVSSGVGLFSIAMMRAAGIPTIHMISHWLDVSIYYGAGWQGRAGELRTVENYVFGGLPSNQLAAAFVDGRWIFIDTHWDGNAGSYRDGVFITGGPPRGLYFDFSIEFMSRERILRVPNLP